MTPELFRIVDLTGRNRIKPVFRNRIVQCLSVHLDRRFLAIFRSGRAQGLSPVCGRFGSVRSREQGLVCLGREDII